MEPGRLNKKLFAIVQATDMVVAWMTRGNVKKWPDSGHLH